MPKHKRGFIDPLSLIAIGFLVTSLVVGVLVTNNPVKKFFVSSYAMLVNEGSSGAQEKTTTAEEVKKARRERDNDAPVYQPATPAVEEKNDEEETSVTTTSGYNLSDIINPDAEENKTGYVKPDGSIAGFYESGGKYYLIAGVERTEKDTAYINYNQADETTKSTIDTLREYVGAGNSITLNQKLEVGAICEAMEGANCSDLTKFASDTIASYGQSPIVADASLTLKDIVGEDADSSGTVKLNQEAEEIPVTQPKTAEQIVQETNQADQKLVQTGNVIQQLNLEETPTPTKSPQQIEEESNLADKIIQFFKPEQPTQQGTSYDISKQSSRFDTETIPNFQTSNQQPLEAERTINLNTTIPTTEITTETKEELDKSLASLGIGSQPSQPVVTFTGQTTSQQLTEAQKNPNAVGGIFSDLLAKIVPQPTAIQNFADCNRPGMTAAQTKSCNEGLSRTLELPLVGNYLTAYQGGVETAWQKSGYASLEACRTDLGNKYGSQAAASCNTYQPTKEQVTSSVNLGTTITAGLATVPATASVLTAGSLGAGFGTAFTSLGAISTMQQTGRAAVAQIEGDTWSYNPEESLKTNAINLAFDPTFQAGLSWVNLASADYLIKSFSTGTNIVKAQWINGAVSVGNAAVDVPMAISTCTQENSDPLSCGFAVTTVIADAGFFGLDFMQGQLPGSKLPTNLTTKVDLPTTSSLSNNPVSNNIAQVNKSSLSAQVADAMDNSLASLKGAPTVVVDQPVDLNRVAQTISQSSISSVVPVVSSNPPLITRVTNTVNDVVNDLQSLARLPGANTVDTPTTSRLGEILEPDVVNVPTQPRPVEVPTSPTQPNPVVKIAEAIVPDDLMTDAEVDEALSFLKGLDIPGDTVDTPVTRVVDAIVPDTPVVGQAIERAVNNALADQLNNLLTGSAPTGGRINTGQRIEDILNRPIVIDNLDTGTLPVKTYQMDDILVTNKPITEDGLTIIRNDITLPVQNKEFFNKYEQFSYSAYSPEKALSHNEVLSMIADPETRIVLVGTGYISESDELTHVGSSLVHQFFKNSPNPEKLLVIDINAPGFGKSVTIDQATNSKTVSSDEFVQLFNNFDQELGRLPKDRTTVIVHSLAGQVGTQLDNFKNVVIIDPTNNPGTNLTVVALNTLNNTGETISKAIPATRPLVDRLTYVVTKMTMGGGSNPNVPAQILSHLNEYNLNPRSAKIQIPELMRPTYDLPLSKSLPENTNFIINKGDILTLASENQTWITNYAKNRSLNPNELIENITTYLPGGHTAVFTDSRQGKLVADTAFSTIYDNYNSTPPTSPTQPSGIAKVWDDFWNKPQVTGNEQSARSAVWERIFSPGKDTGGINITGRNEVDLTDTDIRNGWAGFADDYEFTPPNKVLQRTADFVTGRNNAQPDSITYEGNAKTLEFRNTLPDEDITIRVKPGTDEVEFVRYNEDGTPEIIKTVKAGEDSEFGRVIEINKNDMALVIDDPTTGKPRTILLAEDPNIVKNIQAKLQETFNPTPEQMLANLPENFRTGPKVVDVGGNMPKPVQINILEGIKYANYLSYGSIAAYEIAVHRDALIGFIQEVNQEGYYSPTLNTWIIYNSQTGKWYRVDTGEEIVDDQNLSYMTSSVFRGSGIFEFIGGQATIINSDTYNSEEWKIIEQNVANLTKDDPYNIYLITQAIYNSMIYSPSSSLTQTTGNSFENMLSTLYINLSNRNLQNVISKNNVICFDFAAAEQAYLAKLGIYSEYGSGYVYSDEGELIGGHAFLIITDKNGLEWVADPTGGNVMTLDNYIDEYNIKNLETHPSIYEFINPENAPEYTMGADTGPIASSIQFMQNAAYDIYRQAEVAFQNLFSILPGAKLSSTPPEVVDTNISSDFTNNLALLSDYSSDYSLVLDSDSYNFLMSLPDNHTLTESLTLNLLFNGTEKITLSFPYGGRPVQVRDIKEILNVIQKMGALVKYFPSIEFVKDNSTTRPYIMDLKSIDPLTGRPYLRLVASVGVNSQFDIARALGAVMKYGEYGISNASDLQIAYYNTFYIGKGGSAGNYYGYDPLETFGSYTNISSTENMWNDATSDLAQTFALYITDPEQLKINDPYRYAFLDAIYRGYNPLDVQMVNKDGSVDEKFLETLRIIQINQEVLVQEHKYLINKTWDDLPEDIAVWNSGYRSIVETMSQKYGVPIPVIVGVMQKESGSYNNRETLVSKDGYGSVGLMQVIPDVGRPTRDELFNPTTNIEWGTLILRKIYEDPSLGNGNWRDTLALYNTGGWDTLLNKPIVSQGGYVYADNVLTVAGILPEVVKADSAESLQVAIIKNEQKPEDVEYDSLPQNDIFTNKNLYVQTDPSFKDEIILAGAEYINQKTGKIMYDDRTYNEIGCAPIALANLMTETLRPTTPEQIVNQIPENAWVYGGITFNVGNPPLTILEANGYTMEPYHGETQNLWDHTEENQVILIAAQTTSSNGFLNGTAHDTYMVPTNTPGEFILKDVLPIKDNPEADLLKCKAGSAQTFECSNDTGEWARIDTTNQSVLITTVP